jgi:hypothetical protein
MRRLNPSAFRCQHETDLCSVEILSQAHCHDGLFIVTIDGRQRGDPPGSRHQRVERLSGFRNDPERA